MAVRVSLLFLVLASACSFDVTVGMSPVRFEQSIPNPALAKTGDVVVDEQVNLVSTAGSQYYLSTLGPTKIGALRSVTLTLVDFHIDGVNMQMAGPAMLTIAGQTMVAQPGETVTLDDSQVNWMRSQLLHGDAVTTTLGITLNAPLAALDATSQLLHIVLVVQPTLVVDATSAL